MEQAVPPIWMITDEAGDPSYIRVREGQEATTVGPFAYTNESDARLAAETHSFVPLSLKGDPAVQVAEVTGMGLMQGIMTGFDPSETDVFALDEGLFPLTKHGARWVDHTTGAVVWAPLFQGGDSPLAWLNKILQAVSGLLGVSMVQVNPDPETVLALRADAAKSKIREHVVVRVVPESSALFGAVPPDTTFRVHTSGMATLNRPELELVKVPALFVGPALQSLRGWAAYSIDHPLKAGDSLMGSMEPVTTILAVEGCERGLRISVEQVVYSTSPSKTVN